MQFGLVEAVDAEEGIERPAKRQRGPGRPKKANGKAKAKAKAKAAKAKAAPKKASKKKADDLAGGSDAPGESENKENKRQRKAEGSEGGPAKRTRQPKSKSVPAEVPSAPVEGEQLKCFARRRRPAGELAAVKWDGIREAFNVQIKPHLSSFSAHEARSCTYINAVCNCMLAAPCSRVRVFW